MRKERQRESDLFEVMKQLSQGVPQQLEAGWDPFAPVAACIPCRLAKVLFEGTVFSPEIRILWDLGNWGVAGDLKGTQKEWMAETFGLQRSFLTKAPGTPLWKLWARDCAEHMQELESMMDYPMIDPDHVQAIGAMEDAAIREALAWISTSLWAGQKPRETDALYPLSLVEVATEQYEATVVTDDAHQSYLSWIEAPAVPRTELKMKNVLLSSSYGDLYLEPQSEQEAWDIFGAVERGLEACRVAGRGKARGTLTRWLRKVVLLGVDPLVGMPENLRRWNEQEQSFIMRVPWQKGFHRVPGPRDLNVDIASSGDRWSYAMIKNPDANGLSHFVIQGRPRDQEREQVLAAFATNVAFDPPTRLAACVGALEKRRFRREKLYIDEPQPKHYFATPEHRKGFALLCHLRALLAEQTIGWVKHVVEQEQIDWGGDERFAIESARDCACWCGGL